MINKLGIPLLAFVIASCAASFTYTTNSPMTDTVVRSRDGVLRGKIPQGWFSATEDSLGSAATLLLISDIGGTTITVTPIILDILAFEHIQSHGLPLLAGISASSRSEEPGAVTTEPQEFELRGRKFCSYEITKGPARSRIVVFSVKGKYYECEARGGENGISSERVVRLFTAQQSFLSSLEF